MIFMFISIKFYVFRRRSKGAKVPAIFGRFRRNVMTLDETFSFGLIHFVNFYFLVGLASFHESIRIDHDTARTLILLNTLGNSIK